MANLIGFADKTRAAEFSRDLAPVRTRPAQPEEPPWKSAVTSFLGVGVFLGIIKSVSNWDIRELGGHLVAGALSSPLVYLFARASQEKRKNQIDEASQDSPVASISSDGKRLEFVLESGFRIDERWNRIMRYQRKNGLIEIQFPARGLLTISESAADSQIIEAFDAYTVAERIPSKVCR